MYDRNYDGNQLRFEPSGGLMNSALVMQDKETDSYWSLMSGNSIAGDLKGTHLKELPVGVKTQWKDWVEQHPDTLVLSVDGREWIENNPYDNYFNSEEGYRGTEASDTRLPSKASIFAFQLNGRKYAVPFTAIEGGKSFEAGAAKVFLYRPPGASIFQSTSAWRLGGEGVQQKEGVWLEIDTGARFLGPRDGFEEGARAIRLPGMDTFWYTWSLTNPETELLGHGR